MIVYHFHSLTATVPLIEPLSLNTTSNVGARPTARFNADLETSCQA